ncbi:conjugative coupling factor TraD, PFGI-1 class, partial [Vibrio sp. 10N.222.49.E4]
LYRFARTMEAKHEGRWIERFWSGKRVIARVGKGWGIINTFLSAINPVKPLPPVGGDSRMHGIGLDEEVDCLLPSSARAGHTLV